MGISSGAAAAVAARLAQRPEFAARPSSRFSPTRENAICQRCCFRIGREETPPEGEAMPIRRFADTFPMPRRTLCQFLGRVIVTCPIVLDSCCSATTALRDNSEQSSEISRTKRTTTGKTEDEDQHDYDLGTKGEPLRRHAVSPTRLSPSSYLTCPMTCPRSCSPVGTLGIRHFASSTRPCALFSLCASSLLPAPLLPKIAHAVAVIGQSFLIIVIVLELVLVLGFSRWSFFRFGESLSSVHCCLAAVALEHQ